MAITLRDAAPSDIETLVELYLGKPCFPSLLRDHTAETHRRHFVAGLRMEAHQIGKDKNLRVLIAQDETRGPRGHLILILHTVESITGEHQAMIYDHCLDAETAPPLLGAAAEAALATGNRYLTLEIAPEDEAGAALFTAHDFRPEMFRIVKRIRPSAVDESGRFTVRRAKQTDIFFVLLLNTKCGPYTIPSGRGTTQQEIQERYMEAYMELDLEHDRNLLPLIIEDGASGEAVGYLLLKTGSRDALTGAMLAYIYDIAVSPDYWGKRATQHLVREAENLLLVRGFTYLMGDVCRDNQRALKTATKSLGFSVESVRWCRRLLPTSPGAAPAGEGSESPRSLPAC